MNDKIRAFLVTLGFDKNIKELPKMREVMKKFYKLCLKTHPDKPGGSKEEFQKIEEAVKWVIILLKTLLMKMIMKKI